MVRKFLGNKKVSKLLSVHKSNALWNPSDCFVTIIMWKYNKNLFSREWQNGTDLAAVGCAKCIWEGLFNWHLNDGKEAAEQGYRVQVFQKSLVIHVLIWNSVWHILRTEKKPVMLNIITGGRTGGRRSRGDIQGPYRLWYTGEYSGYYKPMEFNQGSETILFTLKNVYCPCCVE